MAYDLSKRAAKLVESVTRTPATELLDWGIVITFDTESDALLANYAYRRNQFGNIIEQTTDGKFRLTVFNSMAKQLGFV